MLIWFSYGPLGPQPIKAEQNESNDYLRNISELILDYKNEHKGNSPISLNELISENRFNDLRSFYLFYCKIQKQEPEQFDNKGIIDKFYQLAARPGILAMEKPGLWPDGSVAICYDNLTVKRLTRAEFEALSN